MRNIEPEPMLTGASIVVRTEESLTATIDDEIVMLVPERGQYFSLGATGSRIWELLERPMTIDAVCATLVAEFDVDAGRCRTETVGFIEELLQSGLAAIRS